MSRPDSADPAYWDVPEERCERSDLPTSMCAHCRGHEERGTELTAADVVVSAAFEARFPGRCEGCGNAIREGDAIAPLRDSSGYVCPECLP
ncbi:MAG: hypothetical protein HOV66_30545 [Streptomycetaceae bacterium]|nr:hypothetical protein [Streptomycetaceae bacterium]